MLAIAPIRAIGMVLPHGVQGKAYIGRRLRQEDEKNYAAAGVLAYRRSPGGIEVLLGRQSLRQGKGRAGTWSLIGGKRDPGETSAAYTAAREAYEESMGHFTMEWLKKAYTKKPAVLWQPVGAYAVHLAEVESYLLGGMPGVSDCVAMLPTGKPMPLQRHVPPFDYEKAPEAEAANATLAMGQALLDEHGGGPLLLSRFCHKLYERLPSSREIIKQAGGAASWCQQNNIHTASGPTQVVGQETVWLARSDALEVDALMWLPWVFLQTRRNYTDPIPLPNRVEVRLHPYFSRWVLRCRGTEHPVAGQLVREHFDTLNYEFDVMAGGIASRITPFMKSPNRVRGDGRAL
mmetsp:Transcript_13052/g.33462  ORF Transcript_13052/g.33462 Transcript_13052/m.33462 type:complete len:347 (+) Transcript_13052:92-1132(+)